jgi:MerR family transcriptional regulator, redox-sensitive transcriptional activator SoxR
VKCFSLFKVEVQVNLKSRAKRDISQFMSDLLTITEVARRSGVAASALRFYEERGLIQSERAGSRHRRYPRSVLRRIAFLVFAQRVGLTLDEISADLAKLPQDHAPEGQDWARLSTGWTARIDDRIAQLQRMRGGVMKCIGCGCLSLEQCTFANPGDRAARLGPGPRYWIVDHCHTTKPVGNDVKT